MRMPMIVMLASAALAAPACQVQPASPAAEARAPEDGRLMPPEKVADHVWVMRQPDRLWSAVIGNVGIVEQSDGVVLVDSGGTIADGRDVLAAVARLTDKPVKAVIVTHWHNDHPLGVPAILERFPKARVIATAATARAMADPEVLATGIGRPDRALYRARLAAAEARSAEYRKSADDQSLPADLRREYALEAAWVMARVKRQDGNFVVLPTETFTDRLLLADPVAPVEALHLGRANTRGDAFAWLPRQQVMMTGDAVVVPTPYGFVSPVEPWLATLDRLEGYGFRSLVPGHGKVQRDRAYLATLRWSLEDIRRQAAALAKAGATPEQAAERFAKGEHERRFAATDDWSRLWLAGYWLDGMFDTAFKQARGMPPGDGVDGGD